VITKDGVTVAESVVLIDPVENMGATLIKEADKKNWRIVQLPNGYYQAEYNKDPDWIDVTRRETLKACETAIDKSIEHYKKKLEFADGPKVIKTFK